MNSDQLSQRELEDLVDALSDRRITDDQLERLNQAIEHDADSRTQFVKLLSLEAELSRVHHPVEVERASAAGTVELPASGPARERRSPRQVPLWAVFAALAASIMVSIAGSSWLTYQGARGRGPLASMLGDGSAAASAEPQGVASISGTKNCRWSGEDANRLSFGSAIGSDKALTLESGVAELNFVNGARLIIEGPASVRVKDADTVFLYKGRVAAAIPAEAAGFTLTTHGMLVRKAAPSAQYGVVAGGNGASEVHVFEGVLEAQSVDIHGQVTDTLNLTSLEAASLVEAQHRFTRVDLNSEQFVRSIETRNGPGDGLLALDDFSYHVGPLAWQNGGFGWAGPWTVLEAEADEQRPERLNIAGGVENGSLSAAGVVALGNRFVQADNNNRIRRALSTRRGGVFDVAGCVEIIDGLPLLRRTGGAIYLSFMQRTTQRDNTFYGFELHRGDGNYNRVLCIGNAVDGHGYGAAVNFLEPAGEARFVSLGEENDEVNFFVLRIDYGEHEKDVVTIYRNPESTLDESKCTVDARLNGLFGFDRVSVGNFNGDKVHEVDEIRIGTDFRAVAGRLSPREPYSRDRSMAISDAFDRQLRSHCLRAYASNVILASTSTSSN